MNKHLFINEYLINIYISKYQLKKLPLCKVKNRKNVAENADSR
jgi:hypothetical protein